MPHFIQGSFRFEIGKIICIEREKEKDDPVIFLKPPSSIIHQGDEIIHPDNGSDLGYGLFLAMAIGERIDPGGNAKLSNVLGFGILLDIFDINELERARDKGLPWLLAKGRDSFCPISEFSSLKDVGDPYVQEVYMEINGEEVLRSNTRELEIGLEETMQYISERMALAPGDILAVKIKEGGGKVRSNDEIEAGVSSIGIIRNPVRSPSSSP
jgi:2-keto-4-pentenoate hydratase/2-oxohepta-3-ene-1,7-dioic acid hydratase in catechol pathway